MITPQLRQEGQERICTCDIDRCKLIVKRMVEEILSCGNVSLDLTDLRSYDDYTYAYSVNVAVYCGVIGMGMSESELGNLVTAALLHDLGKLQIPDEILNKPGRLTQEEYLIMKSHATLSYQIISERWDISAHIKEAVLHHHENVDGSGYPDGLEGAQQTMFTKILQTFLQEAGPLSAELPGYVPEQLELFGTKVHGIKGASQQIGRQALSESAEIMEMAAKTENIRYLENHMTEFMETIRHTLESVEDELKSMPQETSGEETATGDAPEEKQQILAQLREAFDACDLNGIEQGLSLLARVRLTAEERKLLAELHAAYENLDYEKGSELLS